MDTHQSQDAQESSNVDEWELVAQAQRGHSDAVSALYQAHVQPVYRYILMRVGDSNVAEDLTGEVFLKALEALPGYRQRGRPFAAWLFRIAHARVVDHFRRLARRRQVPLEDAMPSSKPDPEAIAGDREALGEVLSEVIKLTDDQQAVIQFRFIEEMSLEQTARVMGKSVNAVKALQHRALRTLARRLQR